MSFSNQKNDWQHTLLVSKILPVINRSFSPRSVSTAAETGTGARPMHWKGRSGRLFRPAVQAPLSLPGPTSGIEAVMRSGIGILDSRTGKGRPNLRWSTYAMRLPRYRFRMITSGHEYQWLFA